jgi:hypothetical protein
MQKTTVTCDHCGELLDEFKFFIATDVFGTPVRIDLHVQCLAEFAKFCPQLDLARSVS